MPDPANPQSWNKYSYVKNNPINFIDPTGHLEDEGCGSGDLCELPVSEPPPLGGGNDPNSNGKPPSLEEIISYISPDAIFWPTYTMFSLYGRSQGWNQGFFGPFTINGTDVIIMPPGSDSSAPRPGWANRLGMGLGLAGFLLDWGEFAALLNALPGDSESAALLDVVVTYVSGVATGENYMFDRPDPSLPHMITLNQDFFVTAGDVGLAGAAEMAGGAIGGPPGYLIGTGVDFFTTGGSIIYDGLRYFGYLDNHISVGTAVTSTGQINSGDTIILIWP